MVTHGAQTSGQNSAYRHDYVKGFRKEAFCFTRAKGAVIWYSSVDGGYSLMVKPWIVVPVIRVQFSIAAPNGITTAKI